MKEEKLKTKNSTVLAISFAWELGYSIAIPLVALALGGRLLDKRFDTEPFLFLAGVVLSIFISTFIVFKKSVKIMASLEKEAQKESARNASGNDVGEKKENNSPEGERKE